MNWVEELKDVLNEVRSDAETLRRFSRDASIFEVLPKAVAFPKHTEDVKALVRFVSERKNEYPALSLTARAAGTDMTGGPLTDSLLISFTEHMNRLKELTSEHALVQPGLYYRDLEAEMDKIGVIYPSYPASKSICALGGMIANNAGGEKSLVYGETVDHVKRLRVILADGNEYEFRRLGQRELAVKLEQEDFEGEIYRKMHRLIEENYERIMGAKPESPKNAAGYYLWRVWDKEYFDLTQLFVGSQGTLGIWTEAEIDVVKKSDYSRLVVVFLRKLEEMAELVNSSLPYMPETLEAFDDKTLKLALKFFPELARKLGRNLLSFLWDFRREGLMLLAGGMPVFIILVELAGDDEMDVKDRAQSLSKVLKNKRIRNRVLMSEEEGEKYWVIRRESFNLLRRKVDGKSAIPFIDDFNVRPEDLPKFLPELYALLKACGIDPTLTGHAGSGNFHIIPLMDLAKESEQAKIPLVEEKYTKLVMKYHGTITAEHNDGMIRTRYLSEMFGEDIVKIFEQVKDIFDPKGIFNPGKKVRPDWDFAMRHIKARAD